MIVKRRQFPERPDKPNEIRVYLTADQLSRITEQFAQSEMVKHLGELGVQAQRDYCRYLLDLSRRSEPPRTIIDMDGVRLDSAELGNDVVSRFDRQEDLEAFDPDYSPVNLIFHVLKTDDAQALMDFHEDPSGAGFSRLETALSSAKQIVAFCLSPPDLV